MLCIVSHHGNELRGYGPVAISYIDITMRFIGCQFVG